MNIHTKPIPIFKVGRHTDMSGTTLDITEADLEQTVMAYQPSRHEAPLVAGHPQHDAPAWGWVASLALKEGIVWATARQVDPAFAKQVAAGRYKKISASFYTPQAPTNPYPGVYYLRHVGFLGAKPPAVKGLPDVAFREEEQGVVILEIIDYGEDGQDSNLNYSAIQPTQPPWRELEQTLSKKEQMMPNKSEKQELPASSDTPVSSDISTTTNVAVALQRQEADLKKREAQFAEREERLHHAEAELKRQQTTATALQFVEELVQKGRVLPRHRDGLVAFMASLESANTVEFAEPGSEHATEMVMVKTSASEYLHKFLSELPVHVDYAERSADSSEQVDSLAFAAPDGYEVDAVGLEMHRKILAYARSNNMDFVSAALAVDG